MARLRQSGPTARESFDAAENFIVYYGTGREKQLSTYDIAVLEPAGHDAASVAAVREEGTVALAYVSAMEACAATPGFELLREEDFVMNGGRPLMNEEYHNNLIRLDSKRWSALLIHRIGDLVMNRGYDGIFLDTLGDLENPAYPREQYNSALNAVIRLATQVKELFPDSLIVQNNGVGSLCTLTAGFIDGICWENPSIALTRSKHGSVRVMERHLRSLGRVGKLKIFILMSKLDADVRAMAQKNGFLLYVDDNYTK